MNSDSKLSVLTKFTKFRKKPQQPLTDLTKLYSKISHESIYYRRLSETGEIERAIQGWKTLSTQILYELQLLEKKYPNQSNYTEDESNLIGGLRKLYMSSVENLELYKDTPSISEKRTSFSKISSPATGSTATSSSMTSGSGSHKVSRSLFGRMPITLRDAHSSHATPPGSGSSRSNSNTIGMTSNNETKHRNYLAEYEEFLNDTPKSIGNLSPKTTFIDNGSFNDQDVKSNKLKLKTNSISSKNSLTKRSNNKSKPEFIDLTETDHPDNVAADYFADFSKASSATNDHLNVSTPGSPIDFSIEDYFYDDEEQDEGQNRQPAQGGSSSGNNNNVQIKYFTESIESETKSKADNSQQKPKSTIKRPKSSSTNNSTQSKVSSQPKAPVKSTKGSKSLNKPAKPSSIGTKLKSRSAPSLPIKPKVVNKQEVVANAYKKVGLVKAGATTDRKTSKSNSSSKTTSTVTTRKPGLKTRKSNNALNDALLQNSSSAEEVGGFKSKSDLSSSSAQITRATNSRDISPQVSVSKGNTPTLVLANEADLKNKLEEEILDSIPGIDKLSGRQIFQEIVVQGDEVHWDDIAGLETCKNSLKEAVVYPFLRPDLFKGLREPIRGMLLFGPPGTGKTMLARAVATESKSTFFSISASSLTSKYMGESEKLVRALFQIAKKLSPSIIFVDEIDSILGSRNNDGENESSRRIKNEFLIQWSGLSSSTAGSRSDQDKNSSSNVNSQNISNTNGDEDEIDDRVLVLAATNLPWSIDEAARRRFVRRQYIPLPESETRILQIKKLMRNTNNNLFQPFLQDDSVELQNIILLEEWTAGFSGSDITSLCKDAAMGPLRELGDKLLFTPKSDIRPISLKDFENSLRYIKPSVSPAGLQEYDDWARQFGSSGV